MSTCAFARARRVLTAVAAGCLLSASCGGRQDGGAIDDVAADGSSNDGDEGMAARPDAGRLADAKLPANALVSGVVSVDADVDGKVIDGGSGQTDRDGAIDADADTPRVPDCSRGFIPDAYDSSTCPVLSGGMCFASKDDVCACLACEQRCILLLAICGSPCSIPASARCVCADYPLCG